MLLKSWVSKTLVNAGITINGNAPWDVCVKKERFYRRAARGTLGLGEAYMDGDWEVESIDLFFRKLIGSNVGNSSIARLQRLRHDLIAMLSNLQTRSRARAVAEEHYDLDHRMYEQFLGPYNQYTCCFFDDTEELDQAEVIKLEMICDKLEIQPTDKVLDIGCGWGGFAKYAAGTRGCEVTGITLSTEQAAYAQKYTTDLAVEIIVSDYRDLPIIQEDRYDKVLVCGMIEHVGYKNYRRLMQVVSEMLKDDGLFLLHTIGNSNNTLITDPWIEKYIFRNSMIPSMKQLVDAVQDLFVVQDWENYGHYYADTLKAWQENFEKNWDTIKNLKTKRPFDTRFRRMWNYYLMCSKAAFDVESLLLWQIVMTRAGMREGVYSRVNMVS